MTSHEDGYGTRLLRINSRYRSTDSVSNTNFHYEVPSSEVSESVYRVCMTRLSCLYLFPNVDHYNNTFRFASGGMLHTYTMPVGQHTVEQVVQLLTDSTVGLHMTVTFSELTRLISFEAKTTEVTVTAYSTNTLAPLLGFYKSTVPFVFPVGVSTPLPCVPDLGGPQVIYIESPTLASSNCLDSALGSQGGYLALLDQIPLRNTPYGFVIAWEANDLVSSDVDYTSSQSLRRIHIKVTDGHGHVLSLPLNQEVDIVVKLFYKK